MLKRGFFIKIDSVVLPVHSQGGENMFSCCEKNQEGSLRLINTAPWEASRLEDLKERRLYLYGDIMPIEDEDGPFSDASMISAMVEHIFEFNREDKDVPVEDRKPIRLYINSPGGDVTEGFALVSTIELSKTPIYTINIGQWSSMAFLIGITGHRRYSLPYASFLMHDGSTFAFGSSSKAQDKMDFEKRFEKEVIKAHVLKHSKMEESLYDALARVEYYFLPQDAKKHGFIDEIVTDIETIL